MHDQQQARIARAATNAGATLDRGPLGRARSQASAATKTQTAPAQCITLAPAPARLEFFLPVFYTLSGRCRVGMRSGGCIAEIVIAPYSWAVIHGSAGSFEHAMRAAIACDPYVKG